MQNLLLVRALTGPDADLVGSEQLLKIHLESRTNMVLLGLSALPI